MGLKRKKEVKLGWDTIHTSLREFGLPPIVERAARWVERHPKTVLAGALVLAMAVLLTQSPGDAAGDPDPYNGETPLFV
jgi:hypothetical protein